jgi:hypothetical protein
MEERWAFGKLGAGAAHDAAANAILPKEEILLLICC